MSYDGKLMRRAMVRFEEAKQRRADALHALERAVYAAVPRIAEIDAGGEWLALDFDGRKAPYSVEMLSEIDLAYAQTVHKAQGSEYRCVVLAAMPSAPSLMVRGVLYTALTRARELLVIVGDDAAIRSMAANDRQQKRYSGLKWRLCHAGDASE